MNFDDEMKKLNGTPPKSENLADIVYAPRVVRGMLRITDMEGRRVRIPREHVRAMVEFPAFTSPPPEDKEYPVTVRVIFGSGDWVMTYNALGAIEDALATGKRPQAAVKGKEE